MEVNVGMNMDMSVGMVGLGTMGNPLAQRLAQQGQQLYAYDAAPAALKRLTSAVPQVQAASSLAELAGNVSMVITSLPHPDILSSVIGGPGGLCEHLDSGDIVIDVSTSGPAPVQECGRLLAKRGIRMVDAPVGKGPAAALRGDLTLMLGGDSADCRRVEPVMRHVASRVFHCGPLGSAQVIKLANNLVACSNLAALAEAYAFVNSHGADTDVLLEIMSGTYADSYQLQHSVKGKAVEGDFGVVFRLDLATKDMTLVRDAIRDRGLQPNVSEGALRWYTAAVDADHATLDWSAVLLVADPTLGAADPDGE